MTMNQDKMPDVHYRSLEEIEASYWWYRNRKSNALCWLKKYGPYHSMLDLGCGTGGFLKDVSTVLQVERAVGVDASDNALQCCREKGLQVLQQDLAQPFGGASGSYDLVTAMDVLEHMENDGVLLDSICMNLRPGGICLISVPAYPFLYSSWDKHLGHHRRYRRKPLTSLLMQHGLHPQRVSYMFSYIMIPALLRRLLGNSYNQENCSFPDVPKALNALLCGVGRVESAWLGISGIPTGLSLLALARKSAS